MLIRGHVYATEAEAVRACEVLDVAHLDAHGPTEELRTVLGPVSLRRALAAGHVAADGTVTEAGAALGLSRDGAVIRVEVAPRKPWGARPLPLRDGTHLVPWDQRLDAIEGYPVTVRGTADAVPTLAELVEREKTEIVREVEPAEARGR